jgi:ABC-type polysaccharide/polyol phosphate transport system ATPase subunit
VTTTVVVDGLWEGYRPKTGRGGLRRGQWHWALRDVSFEASAGELVGVVGGNGSGKTTLLRCVAGVLRPTRGRVSTSGRVSSLIDLTAGVSRDLTGHENILIGGVLLGMTRAEIQTRYDEIVRFSGLSDDHLSEPIHTYSAGMMLRQACALVLHSDPSVLVVDEVLAVGDEAFHADCLARMDALQSGGCTVVLVSHELELVRERCKRVAVLDTGSLVFDGPTVEALEHYRRIEETRISDSERGRRT